jgi:hypothetical protein
MTWPFGARSRSKERKVLEARAAAPSTAQRNVSGIIKTAGITQL